MNATNRTALRYLGVLFVAIWILSVMNKERYTTGRYGFVDTNPSRRVSGFFDNCSPENMEDCQRNNPYEGLPKP
jgi:hypothetical protein